MTASRVRLQDGGGTTGGLVMSCNCYSRSGCLGSLGLGRGSRLLKWCPFTHALTSIQTHTTFIATCTTDSLPNMARMVPGQSSEVRKDLLWCSVHPSCPKDPKDQPNQTLLQSYSPGGLACCAWVGWPYASSWETRAMGIWPLFLLLFCSQSLLWNQILFCLLFF